MVALPFNAVVAAEPAVWVLHDGKAGMASQALGLAEAAGFPFLERPLTIRRPWAWLPPQLWVEPLRAAADRGLPLAPPWPDLVIGCGRNTAMPALAIKRASGGRTIAAQVQDPGIGRDVFDMMFVPAHDRLRGPNVFVTEGALHRVTPARLEAERRRFPALDALPRPVLAVLVGGSNRAYRLTLRRLANIADIVADALRANGGSAVVTPSRRTGPDGIALLRQRLSGLPADIWDGSGDNPYYAYLALADAVLVSADSVSMVSEAAATGKPVHVFDLEPRFGGRGDAKFARFHAAMRAAGITRPFAGRIESWSYRPLDDTARAGAALRELVLERIAGRRARVPPV
jgi:mitochondrial fission protein ELM1